MAKIKLNLPTGVVEEKTLVTSFEESGSKYVIFDADSVGSMGLPIILVGKLVDNRVSKITDQSEWGNVKTYLKEIIQGTGKKYFAFPESVDADEVYFTQLTLPLASFETIKKAYVPEIEDDASGSSIEAPAVVQETVVNDVAPVSDSVVEHSELVGGDSSVVSDVAPVPEISVDINDNNVASGVTETISEPAPDANPLSEENSSGNAMSAFPDLDLGINFQEPVKSDIVESSENISNSSESTVSSVSNVEQPLVEVSNSDNINVNKEAFLKACGDLFDALVREIKK